MNLMSFALNLFAHAKVIYSQIYIHFNLLILQIYIGDSYVDTISSVESTGTDKIPETAEKNNLGDQNYLLYSEDADKENREIQKQKPSTSKQKQNRNTNECSSKWKEKYFETVEDIEQIRIKNESCENEMKRYHLFLKATSLEQRLGLAPTVIREIRSKISEKVPLVELPIFMKTEAEDITIDEIEFESLNQ